MNMKLMALLFAMIIFIQEKVKIPKNQDVVHFPNNPNVPGVLQLEALAQMLTVAITTLPGNKGRATHAISHTVRFKREILPGEKLEIETKVLSWKRGLCKGLGKGIVAGEIACEAEMIITIPEILDQYIPKK